MAAKDMDWLDNKHEINQAREAEWDRGEARLAGGTDVLPELWPFEWETVAGEDAAIGGVRLTTGDAARDIHTKDIVLGGSGEKVGEHYALRQRSATYMNFPDMYAMAMVGQILRAKPDVDYGTLGPVDRGEGQVDPSRAELFHYNADGVGNDGSQFWNFVRMCATMAAAATGHVWVMVEMPSVAPENFQDEIDGRRPFLRMFRASQVTDHHYVDGRLAYAIIRIPMRAPKVENGKMVGGNTQDGYYLLVRRGWQGFDSSAPAKIKGKFSDGGWFLFDGDKGLLDQGDWTKTGGEIPMAALYYQRAGGTKAGGPAMSRSGTSELGACAVSYMNLSSAADFDVWDGAGSANIVLNATPDSYNVMIAKIRGGNRWAPLQADPVTKTSPSIYDASTGVIAGEAIKMRLDAKREEARELAALEATSVPDSSGVSKAAGFADAKAPRLALMAGEIEQCFNAVLRWVEMRWGRATPPGGPTPPSAVIRMPKDFDLRDVLADLDRYFNIAKLSGLRSKTVDAKGMAMAALETGIITDNDTKKVEAEYGQSSDDLAASEAAFKAAAAPVGGDGGGGGGGSPGAPDAE